ncbi:FAD-dependent oxidoreductase [Streptomyces carpaticus]|uniref:FAD-dependent oxidoreductase n=1 Tax=Streptomyces carpaticus TaxID=285558 RepID=A0ABV4ZN42_9ACTN
MEAAPAAARKGRTRRRALVVGAGIAGSSAAWWLERTGWDVLLVDENRDTSRGAYLIQLDRTALDLAERMGATGIVEAVSFPAPAISLRLGKRPRPRTSSLDVGTYRLAHRGPLIGALFAHVPAAVEQRLGTSLTALEHHDDMVRAHFSDGTADAFDIVVGADGIHSTVRRMMLAPDAHCVYHNGVCHVWINLEADMATGDKAVVVGREGGLLQIYPYPETGRTLLVAALRVPENPDLPALLDQVSGITRRAGKDLANLADATPAATEVRLTRFAQIRQPRWYTRRVVLVGDAAHCIDPLSGMGAHGALLGTSTLARELRTTRDVTQAFARYEARVRPFARISQRATARTVEYFTRTGRRERLTTLAHGLGELAGTLPAALSRSGRRSLAGQATP